MTPAQVWQDFNTEEKLDIVKNDETTENHCAYLVVTVTALKTEQGLLRAVLEIYKPLDKPSDKAVIIVQEYAQRAQWDIVYDLVSKGYTVIIPDCSGIGENYRTEFPVGLEYGDISKAGDHIKKVCPTAKDTCQYLYTAIVRRAATFVIRELKISDIAVIGIGDGVEVAMQAAGCDHRFKALVCVNGAGYKEYLHINKYGDKRELEIDEQMMCWLTGVASVAYAKHISAPVMIAIPSNSDKADIDRLPNLLALLGDNHVSIVITPNSRSSVSQAAYQTIAKWLKGALSGKKLLKRPKTVLSVSDGVVYAEAQADRTKDIKDVYIYYSYGEYDHLVRNWKRADSVAISKTQFIAKLKIDQNKGPLFAFCDIIYKEGFCLSSAETYALLEDLDFKPDVEDSGRIVYEGSMGVASFIEESDKPILLKSGLTQAVTPIGLKGVKSEFGRLLNFDIGRYARQNKGKILQIDVYSDKDITLKIKLTVKGSKGKVEEYEAVSPMKASSGAFVSHKFEANDFKNSKLFSLEDWDSVKAICILNNDAIIGKILFI